MSDILPHMFTPLLALRAYARAAGVEWTDELQASLAEIYRGRVLSDALVDDLVAEIDTERYWRDQQSLDNSPAQDLADSYYGTPTDERSES